MFNLGDKMNSDEVLIGTKRIEAYINAVVTQFDNGMDVVIIKARGMQTPKAIQVAHGIAQVFLEASVEQDSCYVGCIYDDGKLIPEIEIVLKRIES